MRSLRPPRKATHCAKIRHVMYRLLTLVHPLFAQLTLLPSPKILRFTVLFNRPNTPKVPLPMGASTPHLIIHVPWTHATHHPLVQFSCFCIAHGRESLYFTMCIKTWLTHYLWLPYVYVYFHPVSFFFLSFFLSSFFLSSFNLSGRRLDVYHTLAHGVALERI